VTFNVDGGIAGATTGVNVQAGVFVVGVESELLWSGIKGAGQTFLPIAPGAGSALNAATSVRWLSLNSLRVGFVAADRWLVYGKGGVALARENHDLFQSIVQPGIGSISQSLSGSALHTGWLGGVGVE
jgi:opacity protein-like surface antigen